MLFCMYKEDKGCGEGRVEVPISKLILKQRILILGLQGF